MNSLIQGALNLAKACVRTSVAGTVSSVTKWYPCTRIQGSLLDTTKYLPGSITQGLEQFRMGSTLRQIHRNGGLYLRPRRGKNVLEGKPFAKATVIRPVIKKPKKPNSANRKCVLVRLKNGKELYAYVPGIGHNLQEHHIVLVQPAKLQDTPGVNLVCIRGKYDLPHVIPRKQ